MSGAPTRGGAKREGLAPPPGAAERAPPLPQDWTATWLVLSTAVVMGFLAALALAATVSATRLTESWTGALETSVTVVLPEQSGDPAEHMAVALEALASAPGLLEARPIPAEELETILAPLFGEDSETLLEELPTAQMIDVSLTAPSGSARGEAAIEEIARRLEATGLRAEIDDHSGYLARLRPAAAALQSLAWAVLAVVAAASGVMFALSCSTALAAQGKMVDLLRLIGAYDSYVAAIFARRFQMLAFVGSAIGVALAVGAAALATVWTAQAGEAARLAPLLPRFAPDAALWVRLALIPLGFALIAMAAARLAAAVRLRRPEE